MKRILSGLVAAVGLLALSTGVTMAQENMANLNGPDSVVVQNHDSSNNGQQGGNVQVEDDGVAASAGASSNVVLSSDDVAIDAIAAQAPGATAVGGDYVFVGGANWISSPGGYAVENGAVTVSGGVAFGEDADIDSATALVGANGVALATESNLADEGSAVVVGDGNIVAAGEDDSAVVGHTGSALVVDDADSWSVYGGNNVVSMNELEQQVVVLDDFEATGQPILSVGAWTPQEAEDLGLAGTEPSEPTIVTGNIGNTAGGTAAAVSINGMAGLNAFHVNTGSMNQGSVHAVAVLADGIAF